MIECNKCQEYGLRFKRNHEPIKSLEGRSSSSVWIIGLNPAMDQDWIDERSESDLNNYFDDPSKLSSYFKDFERVSPKLFSLFGKEDGVAHADLVKCSSKKWPPDTCKGSKAKNEVVANCKGYLIEQIAKYKPKMIICNGAPISHEIQSILKPVDKNETYYTTESDGLKVIVVLSGFIGRIDNFSRRRLGLEIEGLLEELK